MSRASNDNLTLSFAQAEAMKRFNRDAERSTSTHSEKRLDARQSLEQAKAAIGAREFAILDLVVLRGRSIAVLSSQSGQSVHQLEQLLKQAANGLADHYQTRDAA